MKRFYYKILAVLCAFCILTASLTGCGSSSQGTASTSSVASTITADPIAVEYSSEDKNSSWDSSSATSVTLSSTSITVSGSGAVAKGSNLTITSAGTYVLSGTLNDGQIIVDAGKDDVVRLILNGVSLSCSTGSAIDMEQSQKTIITLAEETKNKVSDAKTYIYPDAATDEPNAAIFSKDDLTINGTGSIVVTGNYKNGIVSKDNLVITGGSIAVTAVNDALRGRDSVAICDGTFTLNAGADGIQANNDEDTSKGWISLDGGTFTVTAGNDAVQAESVLQVSSGSFNLVTGGGSANASTDSKGGERPDWGQWKSPSTQDTAASTATETETASAKGLKAGTGIFITGGSLEIDSSDDAVHSNGSTSVTGGILTISSGDDGIHADSALVINNGTISITKSYEGLEGASITISGGRINLIARDDGLNAAGGNDSSSQNGRPGQNSFSSDTSSYFIRITGGYLSVNASGDGIDANGSLYMDGGTVLVSGPTNDGNGSLDYDGTCEITGGILVAAGSSGMLQTPSTSSTQNTLAVVYTSTQKAGTLVNVTSEDGTSILTFAPAKDYQAIVISTPQLKQKKTYTVYSGGSSTAQSADGLYEQGTCSGSTKLTDVTLSGAVTSISDTGAAVSGGMGGQGGPGPMQDNGGNPGQGRGPAPEEGSEQVQTQSQTAEQS